MLTTRRRPLPSAQEVRVPIEIAPMLEPARQQSEKRMAEAALKEIGGEQLDGSGFEEEENE